MLSAPVLLTLAVLPGSLYLAGQLVARLERARDPHAKAVRFDARMPFLSALSLNFDLILWDSGLVCRSMPFTGSLASPRAHVLVFVFVFVFLPHLQVAAVVQIHHVTPWLVAFQLWCIPVFLTIAATVY